MEVESDSESVQAIPPKIVSLDSITAKSKATYESAYNGFMEWREDNDQTSFSEDVLITYFEEIQDKFKPTTLYALYSKLKTTIGINDNVDLEKYSRLKKFLKKLSKGYQPKKAKTLKISQIETFIQEAPDSKYLAEKVALIMAVAGACRKHELYQMTTSNMKDLGSAVLITVPNLHTKQSRRFVLTGNFYNIFKKYADLHPRNSTETYFFLSLLKGKCSTQRIGINKYGSMIREIAKYLKLPNAELYCFPRSTKILDVDEDPTSVKILSGWKSTTLADEIMKKQFGIANKIINAIDDANVGITSKMESRDESGVCCKIEPKENVIAVQKENAPCFKYWENSVKPS